MVDRRRTPTGQRTGPAQEDAVLVVVGGRPSSFYDVWFYNTTGDSWALAWGGRSTGPLYDVQAGIVGDWMVVYGGTALGGFGSAREELCVFSLLDRR